MYSVFAHMTTNYNISLCLIPKIHSFVYIKEYFLSLFINLGICWGNILAIVIIELKNLTLGYYFSSN